MRRKASPWQRNLGYPLAMLMLLALTVPYYFLYVFLLPVLTLFFTKMVVFNCCIITVCVFSGDVRTDGLFQCAGVAPG